MIVALIVLNSGFIASSSYNALVVMGVNETGNSPGIVNWLNRFEFHVSSSY